MSTSYLGPGESWTAELDRPLEQDVARQRVERAKNLPRLNKEHKARIKALLDKLAPGVTKELAARERKRREEFLEKTEHIDASHDWRKSRTIAARNRALAARDRKEGDSSDV